MSLTNKISGHAFGTDDEEEVEAANSGESVDEETPEERPEEVEEYSEQEDIEEEETSEVETDEPEEPDVETQGTDSPDLDEVWNALDSKVSRTEFEDETDKIWDRVVALEEHSDEETPEPREQEISREEFEELQDDVEELSELVLKLIDEVDESINHH